MNAMKKNMTVKLAAWTATIGIVSCLLTGCSWSIGSGGSGKGETGVRPTRGQELIDLKRAREQGAITEDEYHQQKQRLLDD